MNKIFAINKKLNEWETQQKKLILDSRPIRLGIIATNKCNLSCIMCPALRWSGQYTLTKQALKNIYGLLPYLELINWQGGEIFLIDFLKEIFEDMKNYDNIVHEIITNGLLLDEEWLELLINLKIQLVFSIDSVVPKTYEYIRRGANFKELTAKIELLNEMERKFMKKIPKIIAVVVMRSNVEELELFVDFAKKYNFSTVAFHPISHTDDEENIFKDMTQEDKYTLNAKVENIISLGQAADISIHNRLPKLSFKDNSGFESADHKPGPLFCSLPWASLWIDASKGGMSPQVVCVNGK